MSKILCFCCCGKGTSIFLTFFFNNVVQGIEFGMPFIFMTLPDINNALSQR